MFLSEIQIEKMGFKSVGKNALISDKASFYGIEYISIGDNVRIDDFAVISASKNGINIGNNIHIAVHTSFRGGQNITLKDHTNVAAYTSILSSNDDYSGKYLMGPCQPFCKRKVDERPVMICEYSIIGEHSTILPGVTIHPNSVVGTHSLVKKDIPSNEIWAGNPVKFIKKRDTLEA